MKKLIIISFLLAGINVFAQDDELPKNEKVEAMKVAFITEKLNLSSKEAEVFWPVYREFENEIKLVRKQMRDAAKQYKQKTNATEKEADAYVQEQLTLKQKELDVIKKYITQFKKVLPAQKVARLLSLEQEFKALLLKKLKDRRND